MSSIPLAALSIRPPSVPDPLEQLGKIGALKSQQQQIQAGGLENQQRQMAIKDEQAMTSAMQSWDGSDPNQLPGLVIKNGGSAKAVLGLKSQLLAQKKTYSDIAKDDAETGKNNLDSQIKRNDMLAGQIGNVLQAPDDQLPQAVTQAVQQAVQQGLLDPQHAQGVGQLTQLPPDQIRQKLTFLQKSFMGQKAQQEAAAAQAEANAKAAQLPGQIADSKMKVDEAAIPPEERKNLKATEASLALRASQGDATAEAALKRLDQSRREGRPVNNIMTGNDAKDIADAIENGDQPPTLQGLYRNAGPVRAELARRGTPLAKMELDWKATQKHIQTLNGPQQTRLMQSVTAAGDMLDKVDDLYGQWQKLAPTSGFKVLNKATLAAMKNLPGQAGAIATALDAQIADLTADLGNVYMGGNSPTDHALSLAGKSLSGDWNKETFEEGVKQVRSNIKIRRNSIVNSGVLGLSGDTNYAPQQGAAPSAPAQAAPAAAPSATGPNGHKIVVKDGKWVDAQTGAPI